MRADLLCRRLCLLLLLTFFGVAGASAGTPGIQVQVPSSPLSVGDPLKVQVRASGGEDGLWGEPKVESSGDEDWAVIDGPTAVASATPPTWELSIVPLKVGTLSLPALSVRWRKGQDTPQDIRPAELPKITVASVISPDDQKGPAPLKAPLGVQGFPWEWVLPVTGLLALIAGFIYLIWRFWPWRKKSAAKDIPLLPPWEEFRRAMMEAEGRIGRESAGAICDRLSLVLRKYLERRSDSPAAEMTSSELRFLAKQRQWPVEVQVELNKVTQLFDAVRFARKTVSEAELREGLEGARVLARRLEDFLVPKEEEEAA